MRKEFKMSDEDLETILDACKPVVYIIIGGVIPTSPQENANRAWAKLGERMGFDHMTVKPTRKGNKVFTAEELKL